MCTVWQTDFLSHGGQLQSIAPLNNNGRVAAYIKAWLAPIFLHNSGSQRYHSVAIATSQMSVQTIIYSRYMGFVCAAVCAAAKKQLLVSFVKVCSRLSHIDQVREMDSGVCYHPQHHHHNTSTCHRGQTGETSFTHPRSFSHMKNAERQKERR